MHALEQNEEVHLETPSFHKDGVDLFDGLDFREDPERDIIASKVRKLYIYWKMTSAKEVKSRIDAVYVTPFSRLQVSQFQLTHKQVRLREIFEEVPSERNTFFVHHGGTLWLYWNNHNRLRHRKPQMWYLQRYDL